MRMSLTHLHQRMKRFEYLFLLISAHNILHYFMFLKWVIFSMLLFVDGIVGVSKNLSLNFNQKLEINFVLCSFLFLFLVLLRFEKNLSLNFSQKLENNFVLCSFLFVTKSLLEKEIELCDLRKSIISLDLIFICWIYVVTNGCKSLHIFIMNLECHYILSL